MAILNGEHRKNSPYSSARAENNLRRGRIRDLPHLRSFMAGRSNGNMEAQFEDTIDRLSTHANSTRNPEVSVNAAILAASGINRARRAGLHNLWQRVRHGEDYHRVKPSITHKVLGRLGQVETLHEHLDRRAGAVDHVLHGPVLTDDEQAIWGNSVSPRQVRALKDSMVELSVSRGYNERDAEAFIRSNGLTMYPNLVREHFLPGMPDSKHVHIPPDVIARADFLVRLPETELEHMIDVHENHPR
ncbi:MAG: hypothetical protein WDN66_00585 [Candidatus Saccharibacteria bacterium]